LTARVNPTIYAPPITQASDAQHHAVYSRVDPGGQPWTLAVNLGPWRSTLDRATLPLRQNGDHSHYNNRHIDTYANEDHERPHNHELRPGTCAKAPVRI